ncbi:MAG: hypothetical protein KGK33_12745 [Hyphomicrobiales bacterium]|jgi:hypothetical protein|nr:hypothetical protein [Hyphomicrobiales bacterium]MDE1973586.1 hypothetical protein [Hyphomicrobiales bacterium]MDE2285475.1 hypothetical protein [Hyphomicrobiales bacterium]MDE2373098.1 hypothetical protein [Hyphomicrobiales bacterium]
MNSPATAKLSAPFKRIRLELARSKEFPEGSADRGYEFVAPLDANAHIDAALWRKHREQCGVRRFWGDDQEYGHLVHKPGGPEHARWMFDYAGRAADGDEGGYRFGTHAFRPGEYVSIGDHAGDMHTFRVVAVRAAI